MLDPGWWQYLRVMLAGMKRRRKASVIDARYRYYLAQLAIRGVSDESLEKIQQQAQIAYHDLLGSYEPWQGKTFVDVKQKEFRSARQEYIDAFGVDPADPKFKAWEADTIARAVRGEFSRKLESADSIAIQRMRELEAQQAARKNRKRR